MNQGLLGKIGQKVNNTPGTTKVNVGSTAADKKSADKPASGDTVELTHSAKLLERLEKTLGSLPEIERGRVELDPAKRSKIWKELHARVYELQPYLFGWNVPRKVAFNKNLRGVKLYKFTPGYRLRDMYYEEGTPGTRPLESRT